jgi:DNA primase
MIPQETISRIIESNNIVTIVSEHVKLDKRGVNYIGCCPFHSEKTPSFTVSPAKGIYKCFGCGKSGNVVKFIEEIDNVTWIEAIKTLAEKAKIELPKRDITPEEKAAIDGRERLFIINQFAQKTWRDNFAASPGRTYLLERGFDDTDFEAFGKDDLHVDSANTETR